MNLNKRIDPTAHGEYMASFTATELMELREIYESQNVGYEELSLDEAEENENALPLHRKLAKITRKIRETHVNVLHCGQCGRLYAPTKCDPASDGIPWSEPCGECGAEKKTRAWVLPKGVYDAL